MKDLSEEDKQYLRKKMYMVIFLIWSFGFLLFVSYISNAEEIIRKYSSCHRKQNGMGVVLLGDYHRIQAGLDLLNSNQVVGLFMSGMDADDSIDDLAKDLDDEHKELLNNLKDKIIAGSLSTTTIGGAEEIGIWNDLHNDGNGGKICVITSDYHMPRGRAVFDFWLSDHMDIAYYVVPLDKTYGDFTKLWLMLREYIKFLFTNIYIGGKYVVDYAFA